MKYEANFYLDNSKLESTFIMMAVSCFDGRLKYSTGIKINPKAWTKEIDSLPSNISKKLNDLSREVSHFKILHELTKKKPGMQINEYTKVQIREHLEAFDNKRKPQKPVDNKAARGQMFKDIDQIIAWAKDGDILNPRNGKVYSPSTLANWKKAKDKLEAFNSNLSFDSITPETYESFKTWCNSYVSKKKVVKKQLKVGAVNSYLASWKSLMEIGLRKKLHSNKVCKEFDRIPMKIPHAVYLDDQEIAKILQLPLTGMDEEIRDRYIINLYTGLRISDLKGVDETLIQDNKISITMQKTDKGVSIPLGIKIREIIEKYNGKLPKQYSETQVNRQIKQICKDAGINTIIRYTETIGGKKVNQQKFKWEMITNHTARRSMVTNMLRKGISTLQAQKVVGMSQQTLERYNKLSAEENADLLADHSFFNS
jgi:site-specific recombinase XerD